MIIRFGKFKGMAVVELPTDYLLWLNDQEWMGSRWGEDFAAAVREELERRARRSSPPPPPSPNGDVDRTMALEIIEAGYRSLAKKFHPDLGGRHDQMVSLNRTMDKLRKLFQ